MERAAKNYIDEIVKPLLNRIEYLQRSNEELKVHVKYLQSLVAKEKSYAKPTISAAQHMRESRISSKIDNSPEKRPTWNSKTKIDYAPLVNRESPVTYDKVRVKPPIPKLTKSPSRKDLDEDVRNTGGKQASTRLPQNSTPQEVKNSPQRIVTKAAKRSRQSNENEEQSPFQQNIGQIKERSAEILTLNDKFQQLVKNNTEILTSMKQNSQSARDTMKAAVPSNYVQVGAPKSQYNNESEAGSPIDRSFMSESHLNQLKVQIK